MSDNIKEKHDGTVLSLSGDNISFIGIAPVSYATLSSQINANEYEIYPASQTYDHVLANAGARPANRDVVDARIISEVQNRTGKTPTTIPTLPRFTTINQPFVPIANPHEMYNKNYTNFEHQLHQLAAGVEN
jgi:hypothetical protein